MPEIDLFPRLAKVARAIGSFITERYTEVPYSAAAPERGGAAMLDREIYDQQEFTWTYPDVGNQL